MKYGSRLFTKGGDNQKRPDIVLILKTKQLSKLSSKQKDMYIGFFEYEIENLKSIIKDIKKNKTKWD